MKHLQIASCDRVANDLIFGAASIAASEMLYMEMLYKSQIHGIEGDLQRKCSNQMPCYQ